MNRRGAPLRTMVVLGLGVVLLTGILYYASTVDGRPPTVLRMVLTQHLSTDDAVALTTSSVEVVFSEPVQHASAQAAFAIAPMVDGSFSWSDASMTFTPTDRLPLESSFRVEVAAGVLDQAGNRSRLPAEPFEFETVGNPSVVGSEPADGDEGVALDADIGLTFSTLMDTASVEAALRITPAVEHSLRWSGEQLSIQLAAPLQAGRRYQVSVGTAARDQAGTPLAAEFSLAFRTAASGLAASGIVPADRTQGIAVTTPIAVVFDRALDPESVSDQMLTIEPDLAGSLEVISAPGAAGMRDPDPSILRFQPSGPLQPNTTYQVTLAAGLSGADGSRLEAPISWSFTTGAPSLSLSNQIVFVSDRSGLANLWAMNPDGSNQRQLTAEMSPLTEYAVAPDGRSLVVGDGAQLIRLDADGGNRRVLTDAGHLEFDVAYAPGGRSIVFGRADAATGSGLGLWTRDAGGGGPRPVTLPDGEPTPAGEPTPSPAPPVPLLRAPRYSPDGTALAFVDEAGWVAVLLLDDEVMTRAPFAAAGAPTWLPDGSAVLISGLPGAAGPPLQQAPNTPVAALDPSALGHDEEQVAALQVVRLAPGASALESYAPLPRPARLAVVAGPRLAYVSLDPDDPVAGRLMLLDPGASVGSELMREPGLRESSVAFAPQPEHLLVSRLDASGEPAGIWLLDLADGSAQRLATHGWAPLWLP